MITIKDISKKCGVSPATVSKALNGYDDISPETAALVRRTAKELNYMPNAAARLLKTNRSHNIGVLFIDDSMSGLTHEYFSHILNSVKEESEENGYDITFISKNIGKQKMSFLQHCRYRNCDGVVIANVDFQNPEVLELVNSEYSYDNASSVNSDNQEGSYTLASYIADRGHRKIALIHGERTLVTQKRISGFKTAMEERGIVIPPEYIAEATYHDVESVRKATASMLDLDDPPTAIMFPDDYAFMGGRTEIIERGMSIPEDISACGYDGVNLAKIIDPKLTTWEQNTDKLGRIAVDKLIEKIENPDTAIPEYIVVRGRMYKGETVKQI